ncbi:HNH endonuclease [Vibrio alginolyticus]|uniref:HNH endonuclease n=1 Tax=Vibrio alginolyticus TaxID=663 RepID=UPI0023AF5C64|nr:HNH endonuclease [Vibrio alginolyticus]
MPSITLNEIKPAFELGIEAYEKKISANKLKDQVVALGMTPSSAIGYIDNVGHLFDGRCFTRTINALAADYYFNQIYQRYGIDKLKLAVEALRKHIDYYQSKSGSNPKSMREIYQKYAEICDKNFSFNDLQLQVSISLTDSSEERQFRLESANKTPEVIDSKTKLYRRNPDVIAETLFRAKGKCENCGNDAPFLRKSDNTPYLEVHHKIMLSAGGLDCISNTEALCPNCHRERHYG